MYESECTLGSIKKTLSLYHSFNFQFWSIWLSEFVCTFSFKFRWMSFRCILPSIYYQSCTSGEQYLVSYIYKKHYGFTKLQIQQMKQLRWLGRRRIYLYWFTNWIFLKLKLLMATHCWKAQNNISLGKEMPRFCSIWKTITEFLQRSKVRKGKELSRSLVWILAGVEVPRSGLPVKHRSLPDFESGLQETRVIEERPPNDNSVKSWGSIIETNQMRSNLK